MTKLLLTAALLAAALGRVDAASAQPKHAIPFEAALKDADVTLRSMSSAQTESLILGNGDSH